MVINKQKTGLAVFSKKMPYVLQLSNGVKFTNEIKALGITISHNLTWDKHVSKVINKTSSTIGSLKFLRNYITTQMMI